MNVLVACEFSGRVRDAFIAKGHNAISCDLRPTVLVGPHYQGDVINLIHEKNCFDLMICHPPCTYLTTAAEWAYRETPMINGVLRKMKKGTLVGSTRVKARQEALLFVDLLFNADIDKICLENPVGVINKYLPNMPKPQYVQQHWFGEDASKKTGLWLKGLSNLKPTNKIEPRYVDGHPRWGNQTDSGQNKLPPTKDREKLRSITPQGLANAMAEQWG